MRRRPLVRDRGGAPRLADGGAWFSLSHTEGFAMIGLAAAPPVGVDLERTRPLSIARHRREEICAAAMGAGSAPLPYAEPDRALLQAWVRLEAFAKARGLGLARTLADLRLRGTGYPRPSPPHIEAAARNLTHEAGLTVADVTLPYTLQGAAAVRSGRPLPHPRHLPTDRRSIERLLQQPWCDLHPIPPRGSLATGGVDGSGL